MGTDAVHRTAHGLLGCRHGLRAGPPRVPARSARPGSAEQLALGPGTPGPRPGGGDGQAHPGLSGPRRHGHRGGARRGDARRPWPTRCPARSSWRVWPKPSRSAPRPSTPLTVAQALHWFATAEAIEEMHRVLRPGSRLAVVWNRRDLSDPLQAWLASRSWRRCAVTPRRARPVRGGACSRRRTAKRPAFVPTAQLHTPWRQPIDVDGVAGRVASVSFVAALDDAARRAAARAGADRSPALPAPALAAVHGRDLLLPTRRLKPPMGGWRCDRVRSARAVAPPDAAVGPPDRLDRHRRRMALDL